MAPIPTFSHFVRFAFNLEKTEKVLNRSIRYTIDYNLSEISLYYLIKETILKFVYNFYFGMFFNEKK